MDDLAGWVILLGLIFLFWGEPDNWDKYNKILDDEYQSGQIGEQQPVKEYEEFRQIN